MEEETVNTVSYTHLDVYKRQTYYTGSESYSLSSKADADVYKRQAWKRFERGYYNIRLIAPGVFCSKICLALSWFLLLVQAVKLFVSLLQISANVKVPLYWG